MNFHTQSRFPMGVLALVLSIALLLPAPSFSQTAYGAPPNVYATAATGLGLNYSGGVILQGGAVNTIVPGTLTATNTMTSCVAPAFSLCNFVYWASGTGLSITTVYSTAYAPGNVVVAYVTSTGGNITLVTVPANQPTVPVAVAQNTTTTPYTAFTTLQQPHDLIAPVAITDTIAEYWSQIFIPTSTTLTGACLLNGATVTTDKHIYILFNAAGAIIANTILTSVADSGASRYQCQDFVTPVAVIGPGTFFVGTQPNGTTDTFFTYTAAGAPTKYGTGITAAGVFGTLVAITPTSAFTTAVGPLMMVY